MIQLLEGGGQQFGLHGMPLANNGPWTMARSGFRSGALATVSPPSHARNVSVLVLVALCLQVGACALPVFSHLPQCKVLT